MRCDKRVQRGDGLKQTWQRCPGSKVSGQGPSNRGCAVQGQINRSRVRANRGSSRAVRHLDPPVVLGASWVVAGTHDEPPECLQGPTAGGQNRDRGRTRPARQSWTTRIRGNGEHNNYRVGVGHGGEGLTFLLRMMADTAGVEIMPSLPRRSRE
jgi:hypothetical protein